MASPVWGKFRTTGVEVWVNGFDDADELDKILRRLEGLREVRIGGQWDEVLRIGAGWMSHPFLADLTSLFLDFPFTYINSWELHPYFHLRTLTLGPQVNSDGVIAALLAASSFTSRPHPPRLQPLPPHRGLLPTPPPHSWTHSPL